MRARLRAAAVIVGCLVGCANGLRCGPRLSPEPIPVTVERGLLNCQTMLPEELQSSKGRLAGPCDSPPYG
jgi:hypothetical protein